MLEDVVRREDLRAADVDRQFVADALREAVNEGRLSLSEYDERLAAAYQARTYGELDRLLDDLPAPPRPARQPTVPATTGAGTASPPVDAPATGRPATAGHPLGWLVAIWGGWLTASLICTVIWALSGANLAMFWPGWVIGIGGVAAFGRTVQAMASGDPDRYVRQRNRQRNAERAARRARHHC